MPESVLVPLLAEDDGLSIRGRREGRCGRGCRALESALEVEARSRLFVSSLPELDGSFAESEAEELVIELLEEGGEGWRLREGMMGAGEPMRVGELVALDGVDGIMGWAVGFGSGAWFCRLLLLERMIGLRSLSSRALFLLFSMTETSDALIGELIDTQFWMLAG